MHAVAGGVFGNGGKDPSAAPSRTAPHYADDGRLPRHDRGTRRRRSTDQLHLRHRRPKPRRLLARYRDEYSDPVQPTDE